MVHAFDKMFYGNKPLKSLYEGSKKVWMEPTEAIDQQQIFGVIWNGTSSTLSRSDTAATFGSPRPYLQGVSNGHSPFDRVMPWKGIEKVTISSSQCDHVMVKIPKFWYKLTGSFDSRSTIQIANYPAEGFSVSPAHADRGDGQGERDYAYVGRYLASSSKLASEPNQPVIIAPLSNIRSAHRSYHGTNWEFEDYAMHMTIALLFVVEFASWSVRATIGHGGGASDATRLNTGTTDSMPYHTGTMLSSRDTPGAGVQYRWIEDYWANGPQWIEGLFGNGRYAYGLITNPSNFGMYSTSTMSIARTGASEGYVSSLHHAADVDWDWALTPAYRGGSDSGPTTFITDYALDDMSTNTPVAIGGVYNDPDPKYGMFYLNAKGLSDSSSSVNAFREMYLGE